MSKPFITRAYLLEHRPVTMAMLREARPDLEVIDASGGTVMPEDDAPYAVTTFGPDGRINDFSGCAWVHCAGAGYDKILANADFEPPVLTRTIGTLGNQLAEYVLAYYLRHTQNMALRERLAANRDWQNKQALGDHAFTHRALIFGTGPMGATIARYLGNLGLETIGVARSAREIEGFDKVITLDDLPDHTPGTFYLVVLALPDNDQTRGLIDLSVLGQFKDTLLINVGRGSALPLADLFTALDAGHVAHAVLDVQETEPLPAASPLWDEPRITITPHVSGGTRQEDIAEAFLESLKALERGEAPDLLVWDQRREERAKE
ncbi:NAD(P)-dependent oxidoreductase [Aquisalinus flavus]|uniref:2-hydroxyacid dehydrogenase n=1 Tax=Aquisalinus flavus TaxID=1526572 RepID=A0A8J2Y470_9PROT|nr:NAD(P)-dependent oxidoreductase [Aquisalinus flavus]MBD0425498.1 hypothetical protein [Aquisalinus flavus]UNE48870.1 hypothetical protein FF099_12825 [Aquisalinus flavus]GGD15625.1 2-hydroxyacid dehydrogenase [Aquisalinus flavus]